jgi:putative DNA primase/helicase
MLALARDFKPLADDGANWDRDGALLGAPNGVIELHTGHVRDGRREDRITLSRSVPFNAGARSNLWQQTLRDVLLEDS